MSETGRDHHIPEDEEIQTQEAGGSLFGQLRDQRQKLGKNRKPLVLEIPGYDGMLAARYKMVDWETAKNIGEKTLKSKHPRKELLAQCSLILFACDEILMKDVDGDGKLKPFRDLTLPEAVTPEIGEEGVDWNSDVLDLVFGLDPKPNTSRERVLRIFNNDLAVAAHHQELTEWLQGDTVEDDEAFTEA